MRLANVVSGPIHLSGGSTTRTASSGRSSDWGFLLPLPESTHWIGNVWLERRPLSMAAQSLADCSLSLVLFFRTGLVGVGLRPIPLSSSELFFENLKK